MSTNSERNKILEMVASGTISADEAAKLLSAQVEAQEAAAAEPPPSPKTPEPTELKSQNGQPRWFHVRVSDLNTGKRKVSVNIPIRLMKFGLQIGSRFSPEIADLDVEELSAMLTEGSDMMLVEVEDEEDGEHVQIYVS